MATAIGRKGTRSKVQSRFLAFARNDKRNLVLQVREKMTPQEMRTLYDYNAWANRRAMEAASKLTAEQFVQPMARASAPCATHLRMSTAPSGSGWNAFRADRLRRSRIRRNSRTCRACGSAGTNTNRGS